jgi:two-component system, OmpR family, sensor histidine kinase KdpD
VGVAFAEMSSARGALKVFFGASPGVGKTYAMLEAAQRKKKSGLDVLVGWVETHGRADTAALLEGLERLPARGVEHRGGEVQEFDLDAAVARRPVLLILDELAHSNAPGSRHAKRWQDVEELLDRSIDVWTTLNVQNLESLNDLVARITTVSVRETVPDRLLDEAREVEFVDLPTDDLLQRLKEGRVYIPEQAQRAAASFFRKGNLIALRELALRRTAESLDDEVRDYRRAHSIEQTWPVAERILVCIRPHPESGGLVRAARRLAARLDARWIVAFVESPAQGRLSDAEKLSLASAFKLAGQLGAETAVLSGESVGETVLAYAREHNVSKVVVGKPARPRWRERLFGSPVDAIVRGSGEIDVYAIAGEEAASSPPTPVLAPRRRAWPPAKHFAWAAAMVVVVTLACSAIFPRFDKASLIMIYLAGVAWVAMRFGRWPSALAAALSVAAFDFFFVAPHLTFAVGDTQYLVTFAVMLAVALLISGLAVRLRDQAEASRQRERRTDVLYATSRELSGLLDREEVVRAASRQVADVIHGPAVVFLPDDDGRLRGSTPDPAGVAADSREQAVAEWVFRHGRRAGIGTDTLSGGTALHLPLSGAQGSLGVLAVRPHPSLLPLSPDHLDLLETLARLVAAPLERARLAAAAERARVEVEAERLRNALLSSVSHDIRTPLAVIMGAATGLVEQRQSGASADSELADTILVEADRLNRVVTNLLDMTRLESGAVRLKSEWHSVEELVGGALTRMEKVLGGWRVETAVPADLPLVPVDALLVERVLVNLLDNAAKHTPPGSTIRISASSLGDAVQVEVSDNGPGLSPGEQERIFEKFFRKPSERPAGFGLGLAICRAIVNAHGGRIWAADVAHGASLRFTLPVKGIPPELRAPEATDDSPA